ncbi:ArsR/SmtB family transcription factor [Desertimonas flava]|uniref:ArsR/SmtB family transcription factor n=1 Tax=Desertimonas flava TaxID=2064846 RepID=UPI000E35309D|nr:metalloregulator ArsR/SmtB family transcription factor [Desertimonas flava]
MTAVFEALGEPARRAVLELLGTGEQPAGAIVAAVQDRFPMSQPAVSQHLKVLREAGLVTFRSEGTRRLYRIDEHGVEAAQAWLARLLDSLASLAQPLDALETEVARGRRARRDASPAADASPESAGDSRTA